MNEITLTHGDAQATIALLGAEARSWRVAGRELLWPGDPSIWSGDPAALFPSEPAGYLKCRASSNPGVDPWRTRA